MLLCWRLTGLGQYVNLAGMIAETLPNHLREWRHSRGLSLERLAERVGTDKTQLSRLEKGNRRLTVDWLERLASALQCSSQDLLGEPPSIAPLEPARTRVRGFREAPAAAPIPERRNVGMVDFAGERFAAIPVYDIRAAAGAGGLIEPEQVVQFLLFRASWLRAISNAPLEDLAVIEIDGDSMEPTLRTGDTALIDRAQTMVGRKDGLYVLRRDDALLVKRLSVSWRTGLASVCSDNPSYPTETDIDPKTLDVRGRVIWIGRRL